MIIDQVPKDIAMTKMPKDEARIVILILFLVNFFPLILHPCFLTLLSHIKLA